MKLREKAGRGTRRGHGAAASSGNTATIESMALRVAYDSWVAPLVALRAHRYSLRYVRFEGKRWGAAEVSIELSIKEVGSLRGVRGHVRFAEPIESGTAFLAGGATIAFPIAEDGTFVVGNVKPGIITLELGPAVIEDLEIE